jgi:WD40 repeat protein
MMNTASNQQRCRARLTILLLLLAASACGDLDEKDTYPPSVEALTRWDASHVLALRTYRPEVAIIDLQSGKQTGELNLPKYYDDIESLGNGTFVAEYHQSIDYIDSAGRLDPNRSIPGVGFGGIAVSADYSTLAYSDYVKSSQATIEVVSLQRGVGRFSPPGLYDNAGNSFNDGLVLSRDGNLVAFAEADARFARTYFPDPHAPSEVTVSNCVLTQLNPAYGGGAGTLAFSPVEDRLAVGSVVGSVEVFDLSNHTDCLSLWAISVANPADRIRFIRYSPSGSVLAAAVETSEAEGDTTIGITVIDLLNATSGALLGSFSTYRRGPLGQVSNGPIISDMLWSDAGDRLTLSASGGPVQEWDVATGTLLWEIDL